ncbi:MAG: hypothetical protein HY897_19700 [Deltaproteobacteria bacterium]|nr:hypothetical protein [Deltaproteobacteria bacterium]
MKNNVTFPAVLLAAIAALFACGEDRSVVLDGGAGATCLDCDGGAPDGSAPGPDKTAFVVTTDYSTGSCATIDLATRAATTNLCSIHSDAVARYHNGMVYVINRLEQDNIQILGPANGYATVAQYSVEAGSNPQDIAFAKGKAYVTRQNSNKVLVVKPDSGEKLGEIDLSSFADADGFCEPGAMYSDGTSVFVTVLRLDRNNMLNPTDKSFVAVVDAATDKVAGEGIQLYTVNPWPGFVRDGDYLYLATSGTFGSQNGAVEMIDPAARKDLGISVEARTLGGDINHFTVSKGVIYAVITDANFATALVSYDTAAATRTVLLQSAGFDLAGVAVNDRGEMYVSDRNATKPGIRIFDTKTGTELTPAPIDTGLPPFVTVFVK